MRFQAIAWWPEAWHVFEKNSEGEEVRLGIINRRTVYINGLPRHKWLAHNKHFFDVKPDDGRQHFRSKQEAAAALPREAIHHRSAALTRSS